MKRTKDLLTIILSGYMLLAMGGFSVFHHLCNCTAESKLSTSLLVEQSCCAANSAEPINCHSNSDTSSCGASECDDCSCETEVEVLTVNESLTVENIRLTTPSIYLINIFSIAQEIDNSEINSTPLTSFKDLSPPRPGKSIVISNQCLKIPFRA
jgi:hypothetical protein